MNKNRKKIRVFLLSLFLLGGLFSYASAQNVSSSPQQSKCDDHPPVCLMTPWSFNLYLDFQREMLFLLAKNPFEIQTELVANPEGWLFTNKLLKLNNLETFDDSFLGRTLKITDQALGNVASSTLTSLYLFQLSGLSTLMDNSIWFSILASDRPIVRDWVKILDIERQLIQTAYTIGQAWDIAKTIKSSKLLNELIDRYEAKGLLKEGSQVPESVTYMDVFFTLYSLNMAQRMFLYVWDTSQLRNGIQQGDFQLTFNQEWIDQLKSDYQCVRWKFGYRCNKNARKFKFNIKTLNQNTKKTLGSARNVLKDAWKRFWTAVNSPLFPQFKKGPIASHLSEGELMLLRSVYWINTTDLYVENTIPLLWITQTAKNNWNEVKNQVKNQSLNLWDSAKETSTAIYEAAETSYKGVKQTPKLLAEIGKKAFEKLKNIFKKKGKQTINENNVFPNISIQEAFIQDLALLKEYEYEIRKDTSVNDTLLLSQQFWPLTYKVQRIIQEIWNQNEGLRKEVSSLCNYQCSNSPAVKCYVP